MVKINAKTTKLESSNRAKLETEIKLFDKDNDYVHLLRVIADVLDINAGGGDAYLIIGGTRDHSSLTLAVVVDGERATLYNVSLIGLATDAQSLL